MALTNTGSPPVRSKLDTDSLCYGAGDQCLNDCNDPHSRPAPWYREPGKRWSCACKRHFDNSHLLLPMHGPFGRSEPIWEDDPRYSGLTRNPRWTNQILKETLNYHHE